jgi:hypothetical protein
MLRTVLALSLAAVAAPAVAVERPPVCQALHGLSEAARGGAGPQRIALGGPGPSCRPVVDTPATRAFCEAAIAAAGGDGADMVPWSVHPCVDTLASSVVKTFGDGDVGPKHRRRITRLTASLGGGVRLDLGLTGDHYELVVWSAR